MIPGWSHSCRTYVAGCSKDCHSARHATMMALDFGERLNIRKLSQRFGKFGCCDSRAMLYPDASQVLALLARWFSKFSEFTALQGTPIVFCFQSGSRMWLRLLESGGDIRPNVSANRRAVVSLLGLTRMCTRILYAIKLHVKPVGND